MKIVFSARGSRGDVYPVLYTAAALQRRGHQALVCLPPFFAARAASLGLRCVHYHEDTEAVMRGFGSGWRAAREALRWFAASIEEEFEILLEQTRGADLLCTTAAEVPPASVAEHRGIPHFRVGYAPILPGDQPPPLQPYQNLPVLANRLMWGAINGTIKLLFGTQLNRWRVRLGLPQVAELGMHLAGRSYTLLSISERLAPPSPSWGKYRYSYLGYCFDEEPGQPLPAEVESFLSRGPAPVYVGFGSVHVKEPRRLTLALIDAVQRSGCRVLLGRGWTGLGEGVTLPPQILAVGELPHTLLFPRVAGAIHHGGSGTVHNATRFGLPQVAVPQMADQFFWAHQLWALGLGPRPLAIGRLGASELGSALLALTREPRYRQRALSLGRALSGEPGVSGAVAVIEAETHSVSSEMMGPWTARSSPSAASSSL